MTRLVLVFLLSSLIALPIIAAAPKAKTAIDGKKAVLQPIVKGDPTVGKDKSETERCLECHGSDGNGQGAEGKFAKTE